MTSIAACRSLPPGPSPGRTPEKPRPMSRQGKKPCHRRREIMKSEEQRLSSFLNRALAHPALYSWAVAVAGPVVAAGVVTMLTAGAALAQSSAAAHVYDT